MTNDCGVFGRWFLTYVDNTTNMRQESAVYEERSAIEFRFNIDVSPKVLCSHREVFVPVLNIVAALSFIHFCNKN